MISKIKENIIFGFIIVAIVLTTVKALTMKGIGYGDDINNLYEKFEKIKVETSALKSSLKYEISALKTEISVPKTETCKSTKVEQKLKDHRHKIFGGEVFFK